MKLGWNNVRLEKVSKIQSGVGFPKINQGKTAGDYPFYKVSDMNLSGNEKTLSHAINYINNNTKASLGATLFPAGAIVFPKVGGAINTNKKRSITTPGCADNNIMGLIPEENHLDSRYLHLWMESVTIFDWSNKANPPSITQETVKQIEIPLPPLEEQRRIVAILDESFEGIDKAQANAEANLASAEELFSGYVTKSMEIATQNQQMLGNLSDITYGYTASATANKIGPKFLRITDIQNGTVDWHKVPYCKIDLDDEPKHQLLDGDVVFARTGATTGKSYMIEGTPNAVAASYLIRVRPDKDQVYPLYISFYFQSAKYWRDVSEGIKGSAQGGFNSSKLKSMVIPLPSLAVQRDIVTKLQIAKHEIELLKNNLFIKSNNTSELRQSLLQKAFAGELT